MEKKIKNEIEQFEQNEDKILDPLNYLVKISGKKIRTKLIQSFNYWLRIPEDKLIKIIEIIEMLHNSSLLIDDIEDGSHMRRGHPAAHKVYGVPLTINAANYAYFICLKMTLELNAKQAANIFCEQLIELHKGQGMEIWYRDNYICPNMEQYKDLVIKKTGGLFKLAISLMQIFSTETTEYNFNSLIDTIGLFFQIRDDYANLCSKEYADSKSFCEDLTEGKFSYPVIHSVQSNTNDLRLCEILKQRTTDIEIKKKALEILEETNSFKFTLEALKTLKMKIMENLQKFSPNPYLEQLLGELLKMIDSQKN